MKKEIEQEMYFSILEELKKRGIVHPSEIIVEELCKKWLRDQQKIIPEQQKQRLIEKVVYSFVGFGPLEFLLRDKSVTEIMVNGPDSVFIERKGKLEKTEIFFRDDEQVMGIINRIVSRVGRRIDTQNPMVDARLPDGSRLNAIIAPLSLQGPVVTIRLFPDHVWTFDDLLKAKSMTKEIQCFLEKSVREKKNIVISGGTGSGKTSFLNACVHCVSSQERIITLEDVSEINIKHPHHLKLETRPSNIEGKGEIPMRVLLKNALRMRPDRIIVGEIRGAEVIDMLQAMNTGHKGSLTTIHANSPKECLYRLETMGLTAPENIPIEALRPQIKQGIDLIIQLQRFSDGTRKVISIAEVEKGSGQKEYEVNSLFCFQEQTGNYKNL